MTEQEKLEWWDSLSKNEQLRLRNFHYGERGMISDFEIIKIYDAEHAPKEAPKEYDFVNPSHYQNGGKEVYEMMIDIWGKEAYIKHCEMCAFKYRMRLGLKPDQPIERDLEKAKWYENKAKELSKTNTL